MKIGIVGGTFNPIHVGHLMLGEYAYRECGLDEIWFMPNGNPPHKSLDGISISTDRRVEMTELAISDVSYFKLLRHEIVKQSTSYSYQTIRELREIYPENEFYFVLGSDSLFAIETWKCPDKLLAACTVVVACRENINTEIMNKKIVELESRYHCCIQLLQMPLLEISSSEIRDRIMACKSIKYIVPESVNSYITAHKLYEKI